MAGFRRSLEQCGILRWLEQSVFRKRCFRVPARFGKKTVPPAQCGGDPRACGLPVFSVFFGRFCGDTLLFRGVGAFCYLNFAAKNKRSLKLSIFPFRISSPSLRSSFAFFVFPSAYPPISPLLFTTRWQGTVGLSGFWLHAFPTARLAFGFWIALAISA